MLFRLSSVPVLLSALLLQACSTLNPAAGTYVGEVHSQVPSTVITTFYPEPVQAPQPAYGSYQFAEGRHWVSGTLTHCKMQTEKRAIVCEWQDKYGRGIFEAIFDPQYSSFNGSFGSFCSSNDALFWNGKKQ